MALALLLAGLCSTAQAAEGVWNKNAAGTWISAVNWTGSLPANPGDIAYITNNITTDVNITTVGTATNGAIFIGDADGSNIFKLTGNTGTAPGTNVLDSGVVGIAATLTQISTSKGDTVGLASTSPALSLKLNSDLIISNLSANALTVGAKIVGDKAVTVDGGTGGVMMSSANTFTGGLTLKSGLLKTGTNLGSLGAGALTLSGGELQLLSSASRIMSVTGTTVDGDATITSGRNASGAGLDYTLQTLNIGANTLRVQAGSMITSGTAAVAFDATTISGAAIFDVTNNMAGVASSLTLGALTGTGGSLTKTGNGTMTLTNEATTFDGKITVSMGTLTTTANATNAFGTGGLTVADGGTLILGNASSLNDLSALVLGASSGLELNFTGVDTVGSISLDGGATMLPDGIYNATQLSASGTGSGNLKVVSSKKNALQLFLITSTR